MLSRTPANIVIASALLATVAYAAPLVTNCSDLAKRTDRNGYPAVPEAEARELDEKTMDHSWVTSGDADTCVLMEGVREGRSPLIACLQTCS